MSGAGRSAGNRTPGQHGGRLGVPSRSDDGGRDEFQECCPDRASRSRTRSSTRVIVARSSTMVACKVAITVDITHQNVHLIRLGTLVRRRPRRTIAQWTVARGSRSTRAIRSGPHLWAIRMPVIACSCTGVSAIRGPGPAGPVSQPGQALTRESLPPVGVRRPRDASIGARIGHRCPRRAHVQQPCAPVRGQSGVRVRVLHPKVSLAGVVSTTSTVPGEAFIPFPPAPVNNFVRDDTQI